MTTTDDDKEVRAFTAIDLEVREVDGRPPVIDGYAAVFNDQADLRHFVETIKPGAFTRTLSANADVRATIEHEGGLSLLGRTTSGTLVLRQDSKGLHFEVTPPNTQAGRDAIELLKRGDLNEMSFAFRVPKNGDTWSPASDGRQLRTLVELDLNNGDVSLVTYPAYTQTSAQARDRAAAASQAATVEDEQLTAERAKTQARAAARQRDIEIKELVK